MLLWDSAECVQEARDALEAAEGEATAAQERVKTLEQDIQVVRAQQAAFLSARQPGNSQQVAAHHTAVTSPLQDRMCMRISVSMANWRRR